MKNLLLVMAVIFSTNAIIAQESAKTVFSSPNLSIAVATHKIIAILPFKTAILYRKTPKNYDEQANKEEEISLSYNLQNNFYAIMSIKKDVYPIKVQSSEITNDLLKENNMLNNLNSFTPNQIAKVLGVDAVMYCDYTYTRTNSQFGAIVNQQLFGYGKVATGELTMSIFNGVDGELLWRFNKTMNQVSLANPTFILERMLSKVGRNFPYQK
ncbi:MAG: hypothetical protein RLY43_768 [Bacteroidota bacterium]|jgi:hypothetical protein